MLLRIVSRKWRVKLAFRYDGCKMRVFPKGRVDEDLRAEQRPVTLTLRPWPLTLAPPPGVCRDGGGLGGRPGVSCRKAPRSWRPREPGICAMHTRWSEDQGSPSQPHPACDMLASPSLCICSAAECCNQDEASRWPAPCIGLIPI